MRTHAVDTNKVGVLIQVVVVVVVGGWLGVYTCRVANITPVSWFVVSMLDHLDVARFATLSKL